MYELKKNGKILTSKSVGTGPSSYEKGIYRAAVSQRLRNTDVEDTRPLCSYLQISESYFDFEQNSKAKSQGKFWIDILLFWDVTRHIFVVRYRRFVPFSMDQVQLLKKEPICFPATLVTIP